MNTNKLNSLLFTLIVISAILFGAHYKYTCDKNAIRFYNQGLDLYKQEKYSDAYYNFKQIKSFSKLYELSLLKQYQCANNLADKKTALIKLREDRPLFSISFPLIKLSKTIKYLSERASKS